MTPPERFKGPDDLTAAEHMKIIQARRRGEPEPTFETPEYRAFRVDALRDAGLEDEAAEAAELEGDGDRPLEDLSTAEHLKRIRRNR